MKRALFFCFLIAAGLAAAQPNEGAWVFPMPSGNLGYQLDERGQSIADFSNCGYRGGTEALPDVTALIPQNRWVRVNPDVGDDTARIQAAIDSVAAFALDSNGWRGVVFLEAGEFQLAAPIKITTSGVVLKGAGDSETTGTRLRATATQQYSLIQVSGSSSWSTVSGTTRNFVQKLVPAGARSFQVDSTTGLAVGHTVIVRRPSTTQWIADIGMDQLEFPWQQGSKNLSFDRTITRIDGNWITVDAPLPQTFESKYGGGQIWRYNWSSRIRQVGVEDIFGISDYSNATDEDHAWTFVDMAKTQDSWVRRVTSRYFGYAAVVLRNGGKWITVADSKCLDPISQITGSRRYSFDNEGAELCLFVNDYARKGRHDFVFGATVPGPNAFVECSAEDAYADSGPHHRWTVGGLFDNVSVSNNLNIANRGNMGTGHGWAGAFCTVWNSKAAGFQVRNPPTARNWLVGSVGTLQASSAPVGVDPPGTYDSSGPAGPPVFPHSLYYAQLQQRLKFAGSEFREVWLGDIDQHSSSGNTGESVNCDSTWLAQINALGGATADSLFDRIDSNRHTAFTFDFPLAPGDVVVAASLNISLRAVGGGAADDRLYLDQTASPQTFANLGWNPIPTGGPTVRQLEIDPGLLADGRLNVALGEDTAVDFAVLRLQVRKSPVTRAVILFSAADAYVQGGVNSATNFGTSTTLQTKDVAVTSVTREAFLRWDLTGVTGEIVGATVRLAGISTSQSRNESSASFVPDDSWTEAGLTFDNKPASDVPFAQWLPVSQNPVEFPVTPQVAGEMTGDRKLSLRVRSTGDYGAQGNVTYAARENSNTANRPQLILSILDNPPTIAPIPDLSIPEDTATPVISISLADDADPADLTVTAISSDPILVPAAGIGLSGTGANRFLALTPAAGLNGVATITVTVNDGNSSATATFQLTVTPVDDPPSAAPGTAVTQANQPVDIDLALLASDPDTSVGSLYFRVVAGLNGSVELLPDGHTARFTPAAGFTGTADFTYSVNDASFLPIPVLNYDFQTPDTPADGFCDDVSGNARPASIYLAGDGSAAYSAAVPAALSSFHSQSLQLASSATGTARIQRGPASADLDFLNADWTVSAWFNRAAATDQDVAFHLGNGGGRGATNEFALTFGTGTANTLLYLRNWNGTSLDVDLSASAAPGAWHHVAVTRSGSTLALYVDGVPVGTDSSFQFTFDPSRAFVFGGSTNTLTSAWDRGFTGSIADPAIFPTALSPTEIIRLTGAPAAQVNARASTATVTLTVSKIPATVTLESLFFVGDGTPKSATVVTDPPGLAVDFTYDGANQPPSAPGQYAVMATVSDPAYIGFATGTLVIDGPPTALASSIATMAGIPVEVDLRPLATDAETPAAQLRFSISSTTGGTAERLADGHTVRFTPAPGFTGTATFSYAVIDATPDPRMFLNYDFQTIHLADASGNERPGTCVTSGTGAAVSFPNDSPPALAPQQSKSLALVQNGATGAIRVERSIAPTELDLLNADWTLAGWFKRSTSSSIDSILQLGESGGWASNALSLVLPAGSTSIELRNYNGTTADALITKSGILTGVWHHFAIVRAGTSLFLYVDGEMAGSDDSFAFSFDPTKPLKLGGVAGATSSTFWDRWLDGSLADFCVLQGALAPAEIGRLATGPAANLGGQSATATVSVTVAKLPATVTLGNLEQSYDGTGKSPIATTDPIGLAVVFTYNEQTVAPTSIGSHAVLAEIVDSLYFGSATGTMVIADSIAAWREHYFQTPVNVGIAANSADPDGDGFTNTSEYILGLNPTTSNTDPLTISRTPTGIDLIFTAVRAAGPGFTAKSRHYALEASRNLSSWAAVPDYENLLANDQTVTVSLSAAPPASFYRLRVWLE